jgi:hypothetical protein
MRMVAARAFSGRYARTREAATENRAKIGELLRDTRTRARRRPVSSRNNRTATAF